MALPNKSSVLAAIASFETIGEEEFLRNFATGHRPKEFYLNYKSISIPLKALWAAAHLPPITTRSFTTDKAKAGFAALGFKNWGQKDKAKNDALNDIDTDRVDTRLSTTLTYVRDPRVRAAVMVRAAGICEYCGDEGFADINGISYLECHHIVHLAKEGKDTRTNVIALCPNHHREAHFGQNRDGLEQQMTAIVAGKETTKKKAK